MFSHDVFQNNESNKKKIKKCQEILESELKESPTIKTIIEAISKRNPNVLKNGFSCSICPSTDLKIDPMGIYIPNEKMIKICVNRIPTESSIKSILIHELVHAYV